MKILIHTMYFLPEFGSAPILMNELAAFLAQKGHEVEVVTTIPRPPHGRPYGGRFYIKEGWDGFRVKRFLTNFTPRPIGRLVAWTIFSLFSTIHLLAVRKGDVVCFRMPPLPLGVAAAAAKGRGAKVVLNVQDIHPDLSIEAGLLRNSVAISLARRFEKWAYRQTPNIIVISEGFKKNLTAKGVPPSHIAIIPNWVDTEFLRPLPKQNSLSRKFGLDRRFIVMYSGTLSLSCAGALAKVVDAAVALKGEPEVVFVISGEGLKKEDLRSKATRLGVTNVLFLPFQPYADLPELLATADLLLVPLDVEKSDLSVPSKLYHFMAAGRPLLGLADPESEVSKIIRQTACGVCVPPDDPKQIVHAVVNLKRDPRLCAEMAGRGRAFAEKNFSKDLILQKYEELFRTAR